MYVILLSSTKRKEIKMNYPQFLNHHAAIQNSRRMWKTLKKLDEENKTTSTYKPLEINSFKMSKEVEEKEEKENDLRENPGVIIVMLILVIIAIIIMSMAFGGIKIIIM